MIRLIVSVAQVARLGRHERGLNRLEVAHFADQNDVRILTQGAAQRQRERVGVYADLALVDHRFLVPMQVFDRVFDGHDVRGAGGVDFVDHRRQRGGLARPGGASYQYQAALFLRDPLEDRRQRQVVDGGDVAGDDAEHHADGAALLEGVAAETAQTGHAVGQVHFVLFLELVAVADRKHGGRHRHHLLVLETLVFERGHEAATYPHHRERTYLQVQVRGAAVDGDF
jgi:hypothetical protein